jgi:hypothetical protein
MPYYDMLKLWHQDSTKIRFHTKNDFSKLSDQQKSQKLERLRKLLPQNLERKYEQHVCFNFYKKAIVITARVHPGET